MSASVEIGNAKPLNPQFWEAISIIVNKIDLDIYLHLLSLQTVYKIEHKKAFPLLLFFSTALLLSSVV